MAIVGYDLGPRIGVGGMGEVFRAMRVADGQPVAIKRLHGPVSEISARRFAREAALRIVHPNLLEVLEAGVDTEGGLFLVLELLDGETLESRLARGPLDEAAILTIAHQTAAGLGTLHAHGYVHRDVKPGNLFLTKTGGLKVLDYGIVLPTAAHTRATSEGGVLGTPSYLAPEQARGARDVDARVDVWALGVVLWECVVGRAPFDRETALATVVAVLFDETPPLEHLRPNVSAALVRTIERAMRKDVTERPSSMASFLEGLPAAVPTAWSIMPSGHDVPVDFAPTLEEVGLPSAEQRVLAVLLASGVHDARGLEAAIVAAGGEFTPLAGGRAIGLFGHRAWEGDEVTRAVLAALDARRHASAISVASGRGRLHGTALSGSVLKSAEKGCAAGLDGVAIDDATAAVLPAALARSRHRTGVLEVTHRERESVIESVSEAEPALVGRDAEVARLREALAHSADDGCAVVALVVGPSGIGKSRLSRAAEQLAASTGAEVLLARADPWRGPRTFALFASALRNRMRAHGGSLARRAALARVLSEAGLDAGGDAALFLGVLAEVDVVENDALRAARAEPALMHERLRLASLEWIDALLARSPLAILLDDAHRADRASLTLLTEIVDRSEHKPLFVLVAARPELVDADPDRIAALRPIRIELGGLAGRNVARLANAIARTPLPDARVRAIAERTGGNPFFVEQIVRALDGEDASGNDDLPLPWTVEAAIQSRLDRLPTEEKELCKRASVVRRAFSAADLQALGVIAAAPLLEELGRRDVTARRAGSIEHRFRSPLFADVAYRMLDDALRADLHRRHARALAARPTIDAEEIAVHLELGGDRVAAAARHAEAALIASARADGATVLRCAERALELGVDATTALSLEVARAEVLGFLGDFDRQAQALAAAAVLATAPADRALVRSKDGARLWRVGQRTAALAAFQESLEAARASDDLDARVIALCRCATGLVYGGRSPEAAILLEEADAIESERPVHLRALVAQARADLAAASGDIEAREQAYARAAKLFREAGDARRAASAETNHADVLNRIGAYPEAEVALRLAIDTCKRAGYRVMEGYASVNLGYALTMQGRIDEALVAIDAAERLASGAGEKLLVLFSRLYRLRARASRLEPSEASREADAIAIDAHDAGLGAAEALAHACAARALAAGGDIEGALERSGRAMRILDEHGGIEEDEADILLARIEACVAAGMEGEARSVGDRARSRVRAVAERIVDPARRDRFLSAVPAHAALQARGVSLQ